MLFLATVASFVPCSLEISNTEPFSKPVCKHLGVSTNSGSISPSDHTVCDSSVPQSLSFPTDLRQAVLKGLRDDGGAARYVSWHCKTGDLARKNAGCNQSEKKESQIILVDSQSSLMVSRATDGSFSARNECNHAVCRVIPSRICPLRGGADNSPALRVAHSSDSYWRKNGAKAGMNVHQAVQNTLLTSGMPAAPPEKAQHRTYRMFSSMSDANYTKRNGVPRETTKQWIESAMRLIEFRLHHGHANVPQKYDRDTKLGFWVMNQ